MRAQRKPTSINIDGVLYKQLGVDLRGRGVNYSDWFEDCMRHWLKNPAMEEMPSPISAEKQVMRALRKLLHTEKGQALMVTLPPLLDISRDVLEEFRDKP